MSTAAPTDESSVARAPFEMTRLGSALALAPLGAWVAYHLWANLAAFQGAEAWQAAVTSHESPVAALATTVVVLVPLALHTVWGLSRLRVTRPNLGQYRTYANLKHLVQRLSALGLLLFLGAHLWLAFLHPRLVEGHPEPFADLAREMRSNPPTLVVYVLGVLGVAYHLANGLASVAMGWGLVTSRGALRRFEVVVIAAFAVLLAMGLGAIYALWSAGGTL